MICLKNRNSSILHIESSTGVGTVYLIPQGLFVGSFFFFFFNLTAKARLYHQETPVSMRCNLGQLSLQQETHSVELLIGVIKTVKQTFQLHHLNCWFFQIIQNLLNYEMNAYIIYKHFYPFS